MQSGCVQKQSRKLEDKGWPRLVEVLEYLQCYSLAPSHWISRVLGIVEASSEDAFYPFRQWNSERNSGSQWTNSLSWGLMDHSQWIGLVLELLNLWHQWKVRWWFGHLINMKPQEEEINYARASTFERLNCPWSEILRSFSGKELSKHIWIN